MDIFTALADPTRRQLIEKLHQGGPQSIKQLCQGMQISRQALTKHLNRLIKARIVSAEFVGKEKLHTLQPKSMASLASWIQPFAEQWEVRLAKLQDHLGEKHD